jgi:hypothetical protein
MYIGMEGKCRVFPVSIFSSFFASVLIFIIMLSWYYFKIACYILSKDVFVSFMVTTKEKPLIVTPKIMSENPEQGFLEKNHQTTRQTGKNCLLIAFKSELLHHMKKSKS